MGESVSSVVTASDWSSVISAITAQVDIAQIVAVLASVVGAGIGFVFLWWGVRKAWRVIRDAWQKGKLKF